MLLIERTEGVETKLIKTSYSASAGTAYVTFEDASIYNEVVLHPGIANILILIIGQGSR
jgi:hypothetical protein